MNPEHAITSVQKMFDGLTKYVNSVIQYEITVPMLRFRYDGDDFKSKFEIIDGNRHDAHNLAISEICRMNRLCQHYGIESQLPNIGTYATDDMLNNPNIREEVSNFCGKFVNDTFSKRDDNSHNTELIKDKSSSNNLHNEPDLKKAVHNANNKPYEERIPINTCSIRQDSQQDNYGIV